ncbi:Eukaryotic/viral aspartic protease [Phytophthora sojae]|uniref:Eukaryotic/viral aspartic protease n=1 Tax=Phytophthora sojae (strain P6497) TaxID=1094619 RepID=G4ZA02_PHYSP|nr:Eukaryotic/viral aspartic protease [Phytophthora sojae]EGZ20551.1 Eukaryotic/viral aspartic protease [Phytophthora sojae]|eukprot:XP_009523268.1 Eukaryotic/viral aspartic protease [Phytophthora sojae]
MAKGSKSAVPATPAKSGRGSTEGLSTIASDMTSRLSTISEGSVRLEESVDEDSDANDDMMMNYDDLEEKTPATADEYEDQEEAMVSAGRSGGSRSLSRNLVSEFDEVARPDFADDDSEDGTETLTSRALVQVTKDPRESQGNRPAMNSSTPAANKVLGRVLEQMMEASEWIRQFNPDAVRQATWTELKEELQHPVESSSTTQVVEDTVSLLRAMGFEPMTRPSEASIKDWPPAIAGKELHKWKRKLRLSFGETDLTLGRPPSARPAKEPTDPSKIPLRQTPRKTTKRSSRRQTTDGVFSVKAEGTPYFQDSHMVTPRSATRTERIARETESTRAERSSNRSGSRRSSRRFTPRNDSSSDDDDDDAPDYDGGFDSPSDELARQVREVSEMERLNSTPRIEVATHRPLAQIKNFSGARNRSENSMQWLRAFVYEMKGTHTPPNEWCMDFELSLRDGALHWYRQLPKKPKRRWKLLSDAFIKYYCTQFSQSAKARYYSARRDVSEHLCDYLNRLNGYARNAGLQFEKGDATRRIMCNVSSRRVVTEDSSGGIATFERDERQSEQARDNSRRDRYERRDRDLGRRREDSRYAPRVSLAEASLSDLVAELQVRGTKSGRSDRPEPRGQSRDDSGMTSTPRMKKEAMSQRRMSWRGVLQLKEPTPGPINVKAGVGNPAEASTDPTDTSAETTAMVARVSTDPAQHVVVPDIRHTTATDAADCVNKSTTSANCVYAFVGTSKRPNDKDKEHVEMTEIEKERGETLGGGENCGKNEEDEDGDATEAWVSSAVESERPGRTPSGVTKLLPGARLGWWSAQKFDKRARMRALVKGAVNDTRTRLLLDTGANVSVISEKFAKQLRLRDIQGHGRCMEIQGFTKGTMATERRALVKVTLGWARVYEFELWVMDHGAGVDVVLGTDFMIPAGVRLDLFHATARLPDEVSIPLIKTLCAPDDRGFGPHVNGGPSEDLPVQSQEFVEYRVQRRQPPLDTHEVWVRRTKFLLPTVTKFRQGRSRGFG